ncbi:B3 domain-containing protein REM17 [Brassica napus]|uniref:B3 domain-containing protein REM17 n=1 Tax=Brassica napus TaxID=3708 RepID=UPI0020786759|nr:B3 domain-containing protein REM17 [Brassica napus]
MAHQSLHSPTNPHFFQPLLPGFHTYLNIPVAFFSKHVEGSNDHIKTAKLRTDASAKTWLVEMDGLKLTDGWEDFAVAHDLRIGDIIIFRHEGKMVFHVTAFGPSLCEFQYTSASSHNINDVSDDDHTNKTVTGNSSGEKRKRVKKNPRTKEESSSDHSHFVAHVTPSSLSCDRLYVPKGFAMSNGLDNMSGKEIVLLNEEGKSWNLNITYNESGMHTFVRPGWRRFCAENGISQGHHCTFELVPKSAPPVLRLSRAEHVPKPAPESSLHHSYYVGSVSSNSLRIDKLYLQMKFVTANGMKKGFSEIILKNEWGGRWSVRLRHYASSNHTYLGPGWKTFCQVNGIKAGDPFMFKLVETGDKPVLLLCSSNRGETPLECSEDSDDVNSLSSDTSSGDDSREESQESEEESLEDDSSSKDCVEMEKRKSSLRFKYSKHRFVRLTLTQNALKTSVQHLPLGFTRVNGINRSRKIMLLGKDGVKKWVVDLLKNKSTGAMRIRKGWRELCDAHGVKVGESFLLELIRYEEAIPVLKNSVSTIRFLPNILSAHDIDIRDFFRGFLLKCLTMAHQSLHSPTNPHFFQPLLPGFHTYLNIPVSFFSKHVEGSNDHIKTAKLRTDASPKTWLVEMDGLKLTDGWENFAVAHDLRIGDIIIFRHEGEMVFHVTAFGPSFCGIQYTSASSHNIIDDSQDQTNNTVTGNSSGEKRKRVKKNPRTKEEPSSDHSHFVAHVTPSSLSCDGLYVPKGFAMSNGLDNMSGKDIVLLNEEGRSWNLNITYNESGMHTFVRPGWRRFCAENGMNQGHHCTFELVRKSAPPILRLSRAEHDPKPAPESSLHHSNYVGSVSSNSLKKDKLYIQRKFVNANGLKGLSEIVLKNEWGRSWNLGLRYYESLNHTYLGPGWKTFCQVNGIKTGDSFMFKVVETGDKPVLLLCTTNRGKTPLDCPEDRDDANSHSSDTGSGELQESEEESLEDDGSSSEESFEMVKRENSSRCRASSSYSQDRFVKLTLTPRALKTYKLMLPLDFTRVNGINKPGKITLLDKDGAIKKVVDLLDQNRNIGIMRLGKGWREFCDAHGVKVGQSFLLELIWEDEEAIPVLKFCTKL